MGVCKHHLSGPLFSPAALWMMRQLRRDGYKSRSLNHLPVRPTGAAVMTTTAVVEYVRDEERCTGSLGALDDGAAFACFAVDQWRQFSLAGAMFWPCVLWAREFEMQRPLQR